MERIRLIENELVELKHALRSHKLYSQLKSIRDVRAFMEMHVYAVWDFMSLLKSLQRELTCVNLPWTPPKNSALARFINEIVLEEESDVDMEGHSKSHFEMYLDAMTEVGARTVPIHTFMEEIVAQKDVFEVIENHEVRVSVKEFLRFTFNTISSTKVHCIASAFAFGREGLIPEIFIEIINKTEKRNGSKYPKLLYYLKRHIELDGDDHGPLSMQMIQGLCGDDDEKWQEVLETAKASLEARLKLWNGISQSLINKRSALIML